MEGNRVYGWMIMANKNIKEKFGKNRILIRQKHVKSVKEIVVVDKGVHEYTKS